MVRYITNHDVNGSDGIPQDLFGGNKGAMTAFITAAYMKGAPMIYNGQEVATPYRLTFPFTSETINWTINPEITAEYTRIIDFRNKSTAIRRGTLTSYINADVCAFVKEYNTDKVFVMCNLKNKTVTFTTPTELIGSTWKDAFNDNGITLGDVIQLEPYSYTVLKNQ